MTHRARKTTPRLTLKLAIVASGRSQAVVAQRARIGEIRLSRIVTGRVDATDREKVRLARELGQAVADLFPVPEEPTSGAVA
jgi:plasmid maintenance system antidote protein VapI